VAILITGYDHGMSGIGQKTAPLMESYAKKHGMKFYCHSKYSDKYHPSWQKVRLIVQAIQEGNNVLWLDADTVITNPAEVPWKEFGNKLNVSRDWGCDATELHHFSMGNFYACRDTIMLFRAAESRASKWGNNPLWEQSCLQEMHQALDDARSAIRVHPRRVFNPVPIMAQLTAQEPWKEGDWLCHLTGISNEERLDLFEKIKP